LATAGALGSGGPRRAFADSLGAGAGMTSSVRSRGGQRESHPGLSDRSAAIAGIGGPP